jgi:hypothetical protein
MLGFALAHLHPELLIVGGLGNLSALVWLIAFLFKAIQAKMKKRPSFERLGWVQFALLAGVLGVQSVSYSLWQSITLKLAGPGSVQVDGVTPKTNP